MHLHRLRYTILGLLIYIQSAFCRRICGTDFNDVASKTYLADIVFEGHYDGIHQNQRRNDRQSGGFDNIYDDDTMSIRYNGMFTVQKVMKGNLPRDSSGRRYSPVVAGEFGAPNAEDCVAVIGSPGQGRNSTYIVFLKRSTNPAYPIYKISSYPVLSTKNNLKLVKKIACESCAYPPRIQLTPQNPEFARGGKITLKCKIKSGMPNPLLSWRHDGFELRSGGNIHIRRTRKGSRLQIRNAALRHEGRYECIAGNVVNPSVIAQTIVKVQAWIPQMAAESRSFTLAGSHKERCDSQTYCLNGGTCYILKTLRTKFCQCTADFMGDRCQFRHIFYLLEEIKERDAHERDRTVTIIGLVFGCLVIAAICIASYCLAKKRRLDYQNQKTQKENEKHEEEVKRQAIENEIKAQQMGFKKSGGAGKTRGVITAAIAAASAPKRVTSSGTQTDDQLMRELEGALYSRKRSSESSLKKHVYANGAESPRSANGSYPETKEQRRRGSRESRNGASSQRNGDPYRNDERNGIQYQNEVPLQQQQAPPPVVVTRRKGSRENHQEDLPIYNNTNGGVINPHEYFVNNHSSPVEVHHAKDDHIENYRNGEMQRGRLPGMSTSADALVKELQNHPILGKQAVVNAVVENDRHSPTSPQNSRTESAQDRPEAPLPPPHVPRDSASRLSKGSRGSQGESPNLSLEADQVSDYDNQQASDLEVNMESEADLHALAGPPHLHGTAPQDAVEADPDTSPVEDSSECESTSSSTGVEQMLFSKLTKTKPKVTSLQNMHILDNSYNDEWDTYGRSNYINDPYAFNPYAIDDVDYIKNPLLHGKHPAGLTRHRRHTSLSELQDRLLQHLTDDTDATPV